jgi:hypothetical protein
VRIEQRDVFTLDLSPASVVTLYLLPSLNVKLIPQLEKLKPGCRIVSHDFDMKGVKPDQVITLDANGDPYGDHTIYLWTTPLKRRRKRKVGSDMIPAFPNNTDHCSRTPRPGDFFSRGRGRHFGTSTR